MKKMLVMVLALVLCVSMIAGCGGGGGGGDSKATLSGKYNIATMELDGEDMLALMTEMGMDSDSSYLEFLSDGKCKMCVFDEVNEGTFVVEGNTVKLSGFDDATLLATIDGNKITIEDISDDPASTGYTSSKMIFEKK